MDGVNIYTKHLTVDEIETGLLSGELHEGIFISRTISQQGFIDANGVKLNVAGRRHVNRAITGDQVIFTMLPEDGQSAKIVAIKKHEISAYRCKLMAGTRFLKNQRYIVTPLDIRLPVAHLNVSLDEALCYKGNDLMISIVSWPDNAFFPLGKVERILGESGTTEAEIEKLLFDYDFPPTKFSTDVLRSLPPNTWKVLPADYVNREDLNGHCVISIDKFNTTSKDDAVSWQQLPDGSLEVSIHIVDCTKLVVPGSALDDEAMRRAASVYIPGNRISMLPSLLANDLLSINPGEPRLANTLAVRYIPDGTILTKDFKKSVITSRAALTHQQAATIANSDSADEISITLRGLLQLGRILAKQRRTAGAFPLRIAVKDLAQQPKCQSKDMVQLVENLMLMADVFAADHNIDKLPQISIVRHLPVVSDDQFISVPMESKNSDFDLHPSLRTLFKMQVPIKASLGCYSGMDRRNALDIVSPFSDPARRMADLLVHRQMEIAKGENDHGELATPDRVKAVCDILNKNMHRNRQIIDAAGRIDFEERTEVTSTKGLSTEEEVTIKCISNTEIEVVVNKFLITGFIRLLSSHTALLSQCNGVTVLMCDNVTLAPFDSVVVRAAPGAFDVAGKLVELELISPKIPHLSLESDANEDYLHDDTVFALQTLTRNDSENDDKQDTALPLLTLPQIISGVQSNEVDTQILSIHSLRHLMSGEDEPSIDVIISSQVLPRLVDFLSCSDHSKLKLQLEAALTLKCVASRSSVEIGAVIKADTVASLIRLLPSEHAIVADRAVCILGIIAARSPELRDEILHGGCLEPLLALIQPDCQTSLLRSVTRTLLNLCQRTNLTPPFSAVRSYLRSVALLLDPATDTEALSDLCWVMYNLSDGPVEQLQVLIDAGVVSSLIPLLECDELSVVTPTLRALTNIAGGDDMQTQYIVDRGALTKIRSLLQLEVECIHKCSLWLISNITAGTVQQIQAVIDSGLIPFVRDTISSDCSEIQKEAVRVIANLALGGTVEQMAYLVQCGTIEPLCSVLCGEDEEAIVLSLDVIQNILEAAVVHGQREDLVKRIKEIGGCDNIQELRRHKNKEVCELAAEVIETYFS